MYILENIYTRIYIRIHVHATCSRVGIGKVPIRIARVYNSSVYSSVYVF